MKILKSLMQFFPLFLAYNVVSRTSWDICPVQSDNSKDSYSMLHNLELAFEKLTLHSLYTSQQIAMF